MLIRRDQSRPKVELLRRVANGRERIIAMPVPQNVTKAGLYEDRKELEDDERNSEYWHFQTGR